MLKKSSIPTRNKGRGIYYMDIYEKYKPKPPKIKNLSVAVTAKMHHELLEIGKRRHLTISQMLTDAIETYIWMCNDDE